MATEVCWKVRLSLSLPRDEACDSWGIFSHRLKRFEGSQLPLRLCTDCPTAFASLPCSETAGSADRAGTSVPHSRAAAGSACVPHKGTVVHSHRLTAAWTAQPPTVTMAAMVEVPRSR